MASRKLLDLLNKGIAREIRVSVEYMWNHIKIAGMESETHGDIFKKIAITEMVHAEEIAERLTYLGGTPTTKPEPIFVGGSLKEMIEHDKKDEEGAIKMYKDIIKMAKDEGDEVTKRMFQRILADEEEHHDFFISLLEEV